MDKNKLINEYGANIFDPEKALEYGYVDFAHASRNQALLALLQQAKIDPTKPYQVVELNQKNTYLSKLAGSSPLFTGKIEHTIETGIPRIRDQVAYLYLPN
jgi:hypothetical protein